MSHQTAFLGGTVNTLKWAIVIALLGLGVVASYHFSEQSLLIRMIAWVILFALTSSIAMRTESGKRFWEFVLEARGELRKVVWPTRKETIQTTVMVLAVVGVVSLILWAVDIMLIKVIAWLTGYYGAF